jgi:hypothetical protein
LSRDADGEYSKREYGCNERSHARKDTSGVMVATIKLH